MATSSAYKYNPAEARPEDLEQVFVGRQHVLDRLLAAIAEQTGRGTIQHYLLLGPRGIGKTTMLLMLQRRLKASPALSKKWLVVRYREEEFYVHTLRDLFTLALDNLHVEENIPEAKTFLDRAEQADDDEKSLAAALSGLRSIAATHKKHILLLIDNFDQIFPRRGVAGTDWHVLRKLLSTESFLMVVGTSVQLFEDIAAYDDAFFNFFAPVYLENLSDSQIEELLKKRAEVEGNTVFLDHYQDQREKIRAITYLTGGNPRLVLMLYDILSRKEMLPVVEALRETIDALTPLLKDTLENMPPQQSKILDALMRLNGVASPSEIAAKARLPLNAVTTQLGRLKEARYVESSGEGRGRPSTYRVCDQMFKTWYQMRYLRPARRHIEVFVKFLRAWFPVEERIAQLRELGNDFKQCMSAGQRSEASAIAVGMDYVAASLADEPLRAVCANAVVDAYLSLGQRREAAMVLSDLTGSVAESESEYEAGGYRRLAIRQTDEGDLAGAVDAWIEVLSRNRGDYEARLSLGGLLVRLGRHEQAVNELTTVLGIHGLAISEICHALVERGMARSMLGDFSGALEDYTSALNTENAPQDEVLKALFCRGEARQRSGDVEGAGRDYTAGLEMRIGPSALVAAAFYNRGNARQALGDISGAISDYTKVIEMPSVPTLQVTWSLNNRAIAKAESNDDAGAIADFTAVVTMPQAPKEQVLSALMNLAVIRAKNGDHERAIANCTSVIEERDNPPEARSHAYAIRGLERERMRDIEGADADLAKAMEIGPPPRLLFSVTTGLAVINYKRDRSAEARDWLRRGARLAEGAMSDDEQVQGCLSIVTNVAAHCGLDMGADALETLHGTARPELQVQLVFLRPALEFARARDESALAGLPTEERNIAIRIAGWIDNLQQEVAADS